MNPQNHVIWQNPDGTFTDLARYGDTLGVQALDSDCSPVGPSSPIPLEMLAQALKAWGITLPDVPEPAERWREDGEGGFVRVEPAS